MYYEGTPMFIYNKSVNLLWKNTFCIMGMQQVPYQDDKMQEQDHMRYIISATPTTWGKSQRQLFG